MAQNVFQPAVRRQKWVSVVIGLLFIALGLWCAFTPAATILAFTFLFVAGFFVAGFFELISAFANMSNHNWGWRLTTGILDLVLGVWMCFLPTVQDESVMLLVIGFFLCFYSAMGIGESFQLKKFGDKGWYWTLILCIIGLLCSIGILFSSMFAVVYVTVFVAISFVIYGIFRCLA